MYAKSDFSAKLTLLRKDCSLSIAQLAQKLDMSFEAVRLMERGKRSPSVEILSALVSIFDVPADFFLGRPPFDDWNSVLAYRKEVIAASIHTLGFSTDSFSAISDTDFVRLVGALYSRIEVHPDQHTVSVFPVLLPEDFQRR